MDREPLAVRAAIVAAITAVINVAVAFGANLSVDQVASLNAFIGLAATAVVVVWTRGAVTPLNDPRDDNGQQLVPGDDY